MMNLQEVKTKAAEYERFNTEVFEHKTIQEILEDGGSMMLSCLNNREEVTADYINEELQMIADTPTSEMTAFYSVYFRKLQEANIIPIPEGNTFKDVLDIAIAATASIDEHNFDTYLALVYPNIDLSQIRNKDAYLKLARCMAEAADKVA